MMARLSAFTAVLCEAVSMSYGLELGHITTQLATVANKTQLASTASRTLPRVTTVMEAAQQTLKVVAQDHRNLQAQVAEQQNAAKNLLAAHRSQYESTVRQQVKDNQEEWKKCQILRSELKASTDRVAQLRLQIQAVNNSNDIIRAAMGQLVPTFEMANDFLHQIGTEVPGLERSEMDAIRPAPPEPSLAYYLDKERGQVGLAPTFLQVGSKQDAFKEEEEVSKMAAKGVLPAAMLESLARVAQANQHAEDMLLSRFKGLLEEKTQRHMKLVNDTDRLNKSLAASNAKEAALKKAKAHLSSMNSNLRSRLQGLIVFYMQVGAAMNRTLEEAEAASSMVHV